MNNQASAKFCSKCGETLPSETTSGPAPTQKLAQPPRFTSLAIGELLRDDRYQVLKRIDQGARRHTYLVKDCRCAQCGKIDRKDGQFCENCGASLAHPRLQLLIEGAAASEVSGERLMAQSEVNHPSLVNYSDPFEAALGSAPARSYVLTDPIMADIREFPGAICGRRLSELPPSPGEDVVRYLEEIAPAVDALLDAGLWLPSLERAQLLLIQGKARLDAAATVQLYDKAQRAPITASQLSVLGHLLQRLAAGPLPAAVVALLEEAQRMPAPDARAVGFATALRAAWMGTPRPPMVPAAQVTTQPMTPRPASIVKTQPLAAAGSVPLAVNAGALSDLGNVREINEDSLVKLELDLVHNSSSQPLQLYAVADGMGGHAAGEVASMVAAQELTRSLMGLHSAALVSGAGGANIDLRTLLKGAGQRAARAVYEQAQQAQTDMGTTLVAALVDAKAAKACIINVGDSRLYKVSGPAIRQVTKDHSMVQLLIDKQQLTPEEARRHPNANLIYRTLGDKSAVEIDMYEEPLAAGDALLLCSDGLSGLVEDQELAAAVVQEKTPDAACRRLVKLAKQRGGHDNITVIIAKFSALESTGAQGANGL